MQTDPKAPPWRTPCFAALVIAAAGLLAYHNSFSGPFVLDDLPAIEMNPSLRSLWTAWWPPDELTGLPISGRPVVNLSLGLNFAISGTGVWSYHAVNLLIHVVCGMVLFGVVRRTLLQPALAPRFGRHTFELALATAVLWTVHPLQTESVTYISQRAESLVGLLYFLTLWCFIRAIEPGASRNWSLGAVVACLLGTATKEVIISAPLIAALYDRAFVAGSWREVWVRHRKLLLALAGTWLALAWFVARSGGARGASAGFGLGVSPWNYLLQQCEAIVLYLKLSFWPHPLVLDYGTGVVHSLADVWWQAIIVLALFGATIWALVRKPVSGLLGAWFFLILAPSSSLVPLVGQTMAEHRMYLPLAAVITGGVAALYALRYRPVLRLALAFALTAPLCWLTACRNRDYTTAISIGEDTVAKRPDNARAMALLADYYRRAGQLEKARAWLERSLEVQPGMPPVLNNLGFVWQQLGQAGKAVVCFQQALARSPNDATTRNNLGNALILSGQTSEGIGELETALRLAPNSIGTRLNLANALARSGRMPEAAENFDALLKVQPGNAEAQANYGRVLKSLGRGPEAITHLEAAVRLQPEDADLHSELGTALARAGKIREALTQFEEALRLNPTDEAARQNAARARKILGGN
jgi:tetratricopeptide (TPR) repeat protein